MAKFPIRRRAGRRKILRGRRIGFPASLANPIKAALLAAVAHLQSDTEKSVRKNPESANLSEVNQKYTIVFERIAEGLILKRMIDAASKAAFLATKASIVSIDKNLEVKLSEISETTKAKIAIAAKETAQKIKSIPTEYLESVSKNLSDSILKSQGVKDLVPQIMERGEMTARKAKLIALDQTREVFITASMSTMESAGITSYEWVHSGGSNEPRKYHMARWPAGLNGGIFRFDDPPIADPRTGFRAHPSQCANCRCTIRPVIIYESDSMKLAA